MMARPPPFLPSTLARRFETVRRKAAHDLSRVSSRDHVVDGLLKSLSGLDFVIDTIRGAPDAATAVISLRSELDLSKEQADAVLKLQLGQLTRLNKEKLEKEKETLTAEITSLTTLMEDDASVRSFISTELLELKKKHAVERRTRISEEVRSQRFGRRARSEATSRAARTTPLRLTPTIANTSFAFLSLRPRASTPSASSRTTGAS